MQQFISHIEAFRLIDDYASERPLSSERIAVPSAVGRIITEPVVAQINIPPFTNSARDGFILSEVGRKLALEGKPIDVVGELKAGDSVDHTRTLVGDAARIMTGAPIPEWGYAIAMIEDVTFHNGEIVVNGDVASSTWIRQIGADIEAGTTILEAGRLLIPEHVQALISAGVTEVVVNKAAKVAICSTGDELVDIASDELRSGQIYDSNRPFMESFIHSLKHEVLLSQHIEDTLESMVAFLNKAMDSGADLVMSSGAVSMGSYDFVKPALEMIGAEIVFHKVTQKPGKPLLFAILPNGSLYFGLPGNPVSTVVNCRFYVAHALAVMQHQMMEKPVMLRLANDVEKPEGIALFLKALCTTAEGNVTVKTLEGQESFETSPLLTMNGWVLLAEPLGPLQEGALVKFYPAKPRSLPDIF